MAMTWDKPMEKCLTIPYDRGAFNKKLPEKRQGLTQNISGYGFCSTFTTRKTWARGRQILGLLAPVSPGL